MARLAHFIARFTGDSRWVPPSERARVFQLTFTVRSGNNANLLLINDTSGDITLSPSLNTNVPITASMEVWVSGQSRADRDRAVYDGSLGSWRV